MLCTLEILEHDQMIYNAVKLRAILGLFELDGLESTYLYNKHLPDLHFTIQNHQHHENDYLKSISSKFYEQFFCQWINADLTSGWHRA